MRTPTIELSGDDRRRVQGDEPAVGPWGRVALVLSRRGWTGAQETPAAALGAPI